MAFYRLGRAVGYLVGGQGYHDRRRTETFAHEALERSRVLKRDWNRQVDRAAEEGVHVIYTDGFNRLHKELGKAVSNRKYFDNWPKLMAGQMDRRETLVAATAERGAEVPDHEDYDTWRNVTDFAVGRCEGLLDNPERYGIHLDYIAHTQESLDSALARARCVLDGDDRHLAASLAGQREGEDIRMREQRVACLLDDPEKLREARQQRAERKAERHQQSKGRYWSMRI